MNARIRFAVFALAGLAASAFASAQDTAPLTVAMMTEPAAAEPLNPAPHDKALEPARLAQPCATSTFSELGHGHGDVAGAGYASVHCPNYDQRADAGEHAGF